MTHRVSHSCFQLLDVVWVVCEPIDQLDRFNAGIGNFLSSGGIGAVTYQGSGIGAIEAEERDGRLYGLVGGGVRADLRGKGPRGSCSPGGAEQCLSRQHGVLWERVVDGGSVVKISIDELGPDVKTWGRKTET